MKWRFQLFVAVAVGVTGGILYPLWSATNSQTPPTDPLIPRTDQGGSVSVQTESSQVRVGVAKDAHQEAAEERGFWNRVATENRSWIFLLDGQGNLLRDEKGYPLLSPKGIRYAAFVDEAKQQGLQGAPEQHRWALARLVAEQNPQRHRLPRLCHRSLPQIVPSSRRSPL